MLSIEVNFLTGRYAAASYYDRGRSEWPPHPARLFYALVAAWGDSDRPDPAERAALEWLENQTSPAICASAAARRSVVTHYVPVNDAAVVAPKAYSRRAGEVDELFDRISKARSEGNLGEVRSLETKLEQHRNVTALVARVGNTPDRSAIDLMPPGWVTSGSHTRTGQPREYPSVTPEEPRVTFTWQADPDENTISALDGVCARLTRLGHSSSLVSCRVTPDHPAPNFVPGEGSSFLRSVRSGQLAALEQREHLKQQGSKPSARLPFTAVQYRKTGPGAVANAALKPDTSGEWLVLSFLPGSLNFEPTMAVAVAKALRGAVFHHADDPIPEGLSGHRKAGQPTSAPHAAFLALPQVGYEHANGRLIGAAISLPDALDAESRRAVFRAVGNWEASQDPLTLTLGRPGVIEMERVSGAGRFDSLNTELWKRKSFRWVSATPIALPDHIGALRGARSAAVIKELARAERSVAKSCGHVGLPEPADVVVSLEPMITGVAPAGVFPAFSQGGRKDKPGFRRLAHASVVFDRPVAGPLMLGAGRFFGLGLMRPVDDREEGADA